MTFKYYIISLSEMYNNSKDLQDDTKNNKQSDKITLQ